MEAYILQVKHFISESNYLTFILPGWLFFSVLNATVEKKREAESFPFFTILGNRDSKPFKFGTSETLKKKKETTHNQKQYKIFYKYASTPLIHFALIKARTNNF